MIRALVVDDEAPARSELRYLLARHPEVAIVGEAAGSNEALELARAARPDVVFLDVELPGLTGVQVAALIGESAARPAVVFVTAHAGYAVDAFAVEAFDYLLKPVDPDRLARLVDRLVERAEQGSSEQPAPIEKLPVVGAGGGIELLDFDRIHFAQADGDYARVHVYDRSYLATASLGELERRLPGGRFVRIHRSHLVNLAKVASVRRAGPDRLLVQLADASRTELAVARRQARLLRDRLGL